MNMNLPVLTRIVKKPRAKINPSPIFSLSWVNFRLFKMGKGKMNTERRCQILMLAVSFAEAGQQQTDPASNLRKSSPIIFIVQVTFCRWGLEKEEHS